MGETFDFDAVLKKARGRKANGQKTNGDLEDRVALNFADRYGGHFRYIAAYTQWMMFDGLRWRPERTLVAFDKARELCREAKDTKAKTVAAVVALARSDRAIAATDEQWETDHWIFNMLTGANTND